MHEVLVVTSNYSIEELYKPDTEKHTTNQQEKCHQLIAAIKERFKHIKYFKPNANLKREASE